MHLFQDSLQFVLRLPTYSTMRMVSAVTLALHFKFSSVTKQSNFGVIYIFQQWPLNRLVTVLF